MAKELEIVKASATGMVAVPSFIKSGNREGTEHLTSEDIQMPRLAIAQQMSPELVDDDPKHIPGLKIGEFFNSLTQQIYGTGPLNFCILRASPPKFIEFGEDGKSIVDMNVPVNDPRTQWHGNEKPRAMKFYEFVLMNVDTREMIALSLKSTGIKVAKGLNGLITSRGDFPLFAGKYTFTTTMVTAPKGRFGTYVVRNNGWHDNEDTYNFAASAFKHLKGKTVAVDHEADSFDTDAMDAMEREKGSI